MHDLHHENVRRVTRRQLFGSAGMGIGSVALASLLARDAAASEDTVSGRLRRAVAAMKQPYEQVCQATGIPFQDLADFMAGGQLASDSLDRLAAAAHCELVARDR